MLSDPKKIAESGNIKYFFQFFAVVDNAELSLFFEGFAHYQHYTQTCRGNVFGFRKVNGDLVNAVASVSLNF